MSHQIAPGITISGDSFELDVRVLRPDAGALPWYHSTEARAHSAAVLAASTGDIPPIKCKNEAWRDQTRSNLPKTGTGRGGGWKPVRQLAALEQAQLSYDTPCHSSIAAGDSTRCPPRACDITGAPNAPYLDSRSRLRYAHSSLYPHVAAMPEHISDKTLDLRGAGKKIK